MRAALGRTAASSARHSHSSTAGGGRGSRRNSTWQGALVRSLGGMLRQMLLNGNSAHSAETRSPAVPGIVPRNDYQQPVRVMRILHILDHSLPLQSGYVYRTLGIVNQQRTLGWEPVLHARLA